MGIEELNTYLLSPVAQVALIVGLAEIIKKLGLNKKYIPIVDVVLGLVCGIVAYGVLMKYGILNGAMVGLALGLSACGLFSGIKNLTEETKEDESNVGNSNNG